MQPWPDLTKAIFLDNRGLEPPEPMIRILTALDTLDDDEYVLAHNDRKPMFLFPQLEEQGYEYVTEEQADDSCRIAIRKAPDRGLSK